MTKLERLHRGLDALRIQAEVETADRSTSKRPTWAPAVVLDGELLELCRKVEFLTTDDKPVARLWAVFADPKRQGTMVRTTFSKHPLPNVRCRGFEMYIGTQRGSRSDRMTNAMMDADGDWSIGHIRWGHSNIASIRKLAANFHDIVETTRRKISPYPAPTLRSPEEAYEEELQRLTQLTQKGFKFDGDETIEERARGHMEFIREYGVKEMERWQRLEQNRQDPTFIAECEERIVRYTNLLEEKQRQIAKEEADPDWRYKALTRMTELATQRMLAFAGDVHGERQRGARVTGSCCICGKYLTDKVSIERGIGPECIQGLRTFGATNLAKLKEEMVAAHPDKGGKHERFLEAYARYTEAKTAAERGLPY